MTRSEDFAVLAERLAEYARDDGWNPSPETLQMWSRVFAALLTMKPIENDAMAR